MKTEQLTPEQEQRIVSQLRALYYGQMVWKIPNEAMLQSISNASFSYLDFGYLQLRSIESLTDDEAIQVAKILCGEQYTSIELKNLGHYNRKPVEYIDTLDEKLKILDIQFVTNRENKHDNTVSHKIYICDWGVINHYIRYNDKFELGNNTKQGFVIDYLRQIGIALPIFSLELNRVISVEEQIERKWIVIK